ncbi:hypothetical protein, partial [Pseudomonas viridiflava]|uniref:hypothetical protein n=1 Tax=Pseudomonas viridiflava TaxID=33069 RepID=UPI0019D1669A
MNPPNHRPDEPDRHPAGASAFHPGRTRRTALSVIHKPASTLIVPIASRGHAARDAPRHKWY